jgi:hypothetical protein
LRRCIVFVGFVLVHAVQLLHRGSGFGPTYGGGRAADVVCFT